MSVPHHRGSSLRIALLSVLLQQLIDLRLHRLPQQPTRTSAQQLRQRVAHRIWIPKSNNRILAHGVLSNAENERQIFRSQQSTPLSQLIHQIQL